MAALLEVAHLVKHFTRGKGLLRPGTLVKAAEALKEALIRHLEELKTLPIEELLERRYQKFRAIGEFALATAPSLQVS